MPHEIEIQTRDLLADMSRIEVQTREDGASAITGYASIFYRDNDPGTEYELYPGIRERIMPGAFDRMLKEKHDVRGLVNHDPRMLLGRTAAGTLKMWVDEIGLRYEITPPDTLAARDTIVSLKRGDMSGSSFAFTVKKEGLTFRKEQGFDVLEVFDVNRMYDVGPVTFPAYGGSSAGVREQRSLGLLLELHQEWKRECERNEQEQSQGEDVDRHKHFAYRARLAQLGV